VSLEDARSASYRKSLAISMWLLLASYQIRTHIYDKVLEDTVLLRSSISQSAPLVYDNVSCTSYSLSTYFSIMLLPYDEFSRGGAIWSINEEAH